MSFFLVTAPEEMSFILSGRSPVLSFNHAKPFLYISSPVVFILIMHLIIVSCLSKRDEHEYLRTCFLLAYSWLVWVTRELSLRISNLFGLSPASHSKIYSLFHSLILRCPFIYLISGCIRLSIYTSISHIIPIYLLLTN